LTHGQLGERSVLKAINRFAVEIMSISTRSDLFWYAAKEVVGEMGFVDCIIYQADRDRTKLKQVSAYGLKNPVDRDISNALEIPIGRGITGSVAESGKPCFVGDLSKDSRYIPDVNPALSEVCVPFYSQGVLAGVIDCEDPEIESFDNFHVEILTTIGAMISAKLDSLFEIELSTQQTLALKSSEERFSLAVRGTTDGIWDRDMKTNEVYYSPRLSEMLGYAEYELRPRHKAFLDLLHHDDIATLKANEQQTIDSGGKHIECEFRMRHKNGTWLNILSRGELIWEDGVPVRMVGTHVDITTRKQFEEELRRTEEMLFEGIEALPVGFAFFDEHDKLALFNTKYRSFLSESAHLIEEGMFLEALVRDTANVAAALFRYKDKEEYIQARLRSVREDANDWIYTPSIGRWISATERTTNSGGFISIIEDITDHKEAEKAVGALLEHLREALSAARIASWELDADGNLYWSPELFELFGVDKENFDGTTAYFYKHVHSDDRERVAESFDFAWANLERYLAEHRIIKGDGSTITVRETGKIVRDENLNAIKVIGMVQDVSEIVTLERKLQQAQKMEAIGQLSGGIAHDFNNLLAVIQGNAELLGELDGQHPHMIADIIKASGRGAELTQRLLAFSRQQPLFSEEVDLCALTSDMLELLRRTLGVTIEIETFASENLRHAIADAGQVENALLNLAINARDAMPNGGKLTIGCSNMTLNDDNSNKISGISAGDYVVLSVTDSGVGMSAEVQRHAFEPFFTTKGVGQGSGLGLSMVYGFAQQSGGQATIYSEKGKGTTVKLYLPVAVPITDEEKKPQVTEAVPRGHGETILVIEDDPQVRTLAELMLMNLGYKVLYAEDANAARQSTNTHPEIALILSDVILPGGTSGPEFAVELRAEHPKLPIIFMSGYPAEAAKRNGFLGSDNVLLNKPFKIRELAMVVKNGLMTRSRQLG